MKNLIFFTLDLSNKIHVKEGKSSNKPLAIALVADLAQLGYSLDKELFNKVASLSRSEIKELKNWLIGELSVKVGSHVKYKPLFVNFPDDVPDENEYLYLRISNFLENIFQVSNIEDGELLSCGCLVNKAYFDLNMFGACPICQRQVSETGTSSPRKKIRQAVVLKKIGYISEQEEVSLVRQTMLSKSAYSPNTKLILKKVFSIYQDEVFSYLPLTYVNKENLAYISSLVKKNTKIGINYSLFNTATDVLRLAVALSEGDESLKVKSNFKLTSSERKLVLNILENVNNSVEDMLRHEQSWLRLGEYLHIGAYKKQYTKSFAAINSLRNHKAVVKAGTFNSKAHKLMLDFKSKKFDLKLVLSELAQRPGELARRLDFILRETNESSDVIKQFSEVVGQVTTTMLLKMSQYFKGRNSTLEFRYYIPKGQMAKIWFSEGDQRKPLSQETINQLTGIIDSEIMKRYASKEKVSNIYIDPSLKTMLVPFIQRNATKNIESLYRGSKASFSDKATALRLFLYWKENEKSGRIDVDLSAGGFDSKWNYVTNLSWTSLSSMDCQHSGDIQSAPNGASEFIDINVESMKSNKIRYVVVNVFSWTGQKFCDFECFAGVMERNKTNSGENFEAKTVKNKFDLSGDSTVNAPMIIDLDTNEIIWADIAFSSESGRRVENSTKKIAMLGKTLIAMGTQEQNLFNLFELYAKSQGAVLYTEKVEGVEFDLEISTEQAKDVVNILSSWI